MLRALQRAFDGDPNNIIAARTLMGRLRTTAVQVVKLVDPATGMNVGLTYEHMPAVVS